MRLLGRVLSSASTSVRSEAASSCPSASSKIKASKKQNSLRPFSEIPGPASIPLFGNQHNVFQSQSSIQNYFDYLAKLYESYGSVVKVDLGFGRGYVVHVFDPEDSRVVFSADGRQPHIVPLQETTKKYREAKGINPGLGNLNGEEWYRLRSSVQQAMMRPQAVQNYLPFTNQVAEQLVDHIKNSKDGQGQVDMRKVAGRWSLESAGQIVFEKRLGALSDNVAWADRLVDVNKEIFQLSAKLKFGLPFFRFITTPGWKRMVDLEDEFYGEVDKLMNEAIEKLKSQEEKSDMLFASYLINRPELTKVDIKVILLSLFSDGLSTTAPMLIYNLFNIAKHHDVQERLRAEVKQEIRDNEEITPESLTRLPYLRACIKETFRLFPIGTEISRVPQKDIVVGGYNVPSGTPVDINTNILMRSPGLFSDPLAFKPERWLRGSDKQDQGHPFAFLPFGFGPRMCAGRRFAEQDLNTVLARLVSSFRIEHRHEPISQIYETLLLPRGNCNFHMTPL